MRQRNRLDAPPLSPLEQVSSIRRELLEVERGDTDLDIVLRSVRRRLRAIEHQLLAKRKRHAS